MNTEAFIGLMSGTSMDGVDGVIARFDTETGAWGGIVARASVPMPEDLQRELLALNRPGADEIHRAALASQALSRLYAEVVGALRAPHPELDIRAVGAHGQTVRHRPDAGYTTQLLAPALLAELIGIDVVCDFRSRDIAAGGQGAPLVPAFHQRVFGSSQGTVAVLNVGGMANVSLIDPGIGVRGHDCGPGNVLMDLWCRRWTGQAFDQDGLWAASGQVVPAWLDAALEEPYFHLAPPKSTGRDLFDDAWLQNWLQRCDGWPEQETQQRSRAADVQATLCELTARTAARAAAEEGWLPEELLVCGGGALNGHLMRRLSALLPGVPVMSTEQRGLPVFDVEAAAFAWLASAACNGLAANEPAVTGARGLRVLGAIYPA